MTRLFLSICLILTAATSWSAPGDTTPATKAFRCYSATGGKVCPDGFNQTLKIPGATGNATAKTITIPAQVNSDWTASSGTAQILNKPPLGTSAAKDIPASGNASASQVVYGTDTRLSDSRPASDVSAWAKAGTKPAYTYTEVGADQAGAAAAVKDTTTKTGILKGGSGVVSAAANSDLPAMSATVGGAVPTPPNNTTTFLRGDGTFAVPPSGTGTVTSVGGTGTVSGLTLSGAVTTSGNLTLGGAITGFATGAGSASGANTVDVTISTANGLSLSGQALSLAAATDSVPGAMSAADHMILTYLNTLFPYSTGIDSYTKLMLHLDNDVTDSETTPKTVTNNAATFSNVTYKFGYSGVFNGTSAYLTIPNSADFNPGSGPFTIDFWAYANSWSTTPVMFHRSSTGGYYYALQYTGGVMQFLASSNGSSWDICSGLSFGNPSTGAWHHYAIVRSGTNFTTYLDGTAVSATASAAAINSASTTFIIGAAASSFFFNGYIDEFRYSLKARWNSNFTPPTGAYY